MFDDTKLVRLNDVFPGWLSGGGIFSTLQMFPVPWKGENISSALDVEYHGNVSGDKIISPLVEKIKSGDTLTEAEKTLIATSILSVCGVNWGKQYETLSLEYNPIENYRMTERMTNDRTITEYGKTTTRTDELTHSKTGTETDDISETDTRTDNLTHKKTGTETVANNFVDTTTPNVTKSVNNKVYGFNSWEGIKSDEQAGTETGTNTFDHTGTENKNYDLSDVDTGTQTVVKDGMNTTTFNTTDTDNGTQTFLDGGSDTNTRNYEMTRSGNIGVTTSQQMIESQRDLWRWNFFHDVVFPDIDRVLTIQIY